MSHDDSSGTNTEHKFFVKNTGVAQEEKPWLTDEYTYCKEYTVD